MLDLALDPVVAFPSVQTPFAGLDLELVQQGHDDLRLQLHPGGGHGERGHDAGGSLLVVEGHGRRREASQVGLGVAHGVRRVLVCLGPPLRRVPRTHGLGEGGVVAHGVERRVDPTERVGRQEAFVELPGGVVGRRLTAGLRVTPGRVLVATHGHRCHLLLIVELQAPTRGRSAGGVLDRSRPGHVWLTATFDVDQVPPLHRVVEGRADVDLAGVVHPHHARCVHAVAEYVDHAEHGVGAAPVVDLDSKPEPADLEAVRLQVLRHALDGAEVPAADLAPRSPQAQVPVMERRPVEIPLDPRRRPRPVQVGVVLAGVEEPHPAGLVVAGADGLGQILGEGELFSAQRAAAAERRHVAIGPAGHGQGHERPAPRPAQQEHLVRLGPRRDRPVHLDVGDGPSLDR